MLKRIVLISVLILVLICGTALAEQPFEVENPGKVLEELGINDKVSIILVDLYKNEVLFEQNAHSKLKTASTSKLLTCIVALENCELDEIVTISKVSARTGGSSLELKRDEQLSLYDLLSGMMVTSGNDAANAVAEHISGSQKEFAVLMNETAQRIGMSDSCFTNSIGTSDKDNYSTAFDMAKLAEYAMLNEQLTEMTSRISYMIPETNLQPQREVYSTNMLFYQDSEFYYEYSTGLKTGTSRKAKGNLVATAQKDGVSLVCVVMNDRSSRYTDRWRIAKALFEYGFSKYTVLNVNELLEKQSEIEIELDNGINCCVEDMEETFLAVRKQEADIISSTGIQQSVTAQDIDLPILKGDTVGSITFYNKSTGIQLYSGQLIALNSIYEGRPVSHEGIIKETGEEPLPEPVPDTSEIRGDANSHIFWLQTAFFALITCLLILIFRVIVSNKEYKK